MKVVRQIFCLYQFITVVVPIPPKYLVDSTQLIHELLQQGKIGEFLGKTVRESAKPTKYTDKNGL